MRGSRTGRFAALLVMGVSLTGCGMVTLPKSGLPAPASGSSTQAPLGGPTNKLSGGPVTCDGAADGCTKSGQLRWSVPLKGTYRLHHDRLNPVALSDDSERMALAWTKGTVFLASGNRVLAVDAATGKVRWRRVYPSSTYLGWGEPELMVASGRLVVRQRMLAPGATTRGRYLSLDPGTGTSFVIPGYQGWEHAVTGDRARGLLLLASTKTRMIDPATGKRRWQVTVGEHDEAYARGGVLYLHKDGGGHIQRVDLDAGTRLPDVRLPGSVSPDAYLWYVTSHRIAVFSDDQRRSAAVDMHGNRVRHVPPEPADGRDPSNRLRVAGPSDGLQHLTRRTGTRWTGPTMRAAYSEALALTATMPRLAVVPACAPNGVRPGTTTDPYLSYYCTKPRLIAVTW